MIHPFIPKFDGNGKISWECNDCCEVYRNFSPEIQSTVERAIEGVSKETMNAMNDHQAGHGFTFCKIGEKNAK